MMQPTGDARPPRQQEQTTRTTEQIEDAPMSPTRLAQGISAALLLTTAAASQAHHGFGLFQMQLDAEWSGTLTKMELVNPHSYMYFDSVDANGQTVSMRCE